MEVFFASGPRRQLRDGWSLLFLVYIEASPASDRLYAEIAMLVTTAVEGQIQIITEEQIRGPAHLYLLV
jgi:hypothetical protein